MADINQNELNFEDNENGDAIDIPKEVRKIRTQAYDKAVSDLVRMIDEKEIILDPDFQREYVWDNKKASQLLESIMLNVPIPVVYVSEEEDGTWTVIDGLQRLNSLYRFFKSKYKISGLDVLKELNKSTVDNLNIKAKRVLKNGLIRIIVITHESHPDIKYDIFMRLNSGSVKLSDQELRNCLYRGSLNQALKDMRINNKFFSLLNLKGPHSRMGDCELALRYIVFTSNWEPNISEVSKYKGRIKTFLNEYMDENKNINEKEIIFIRKKFIDTIDKVFSVIGENAFKRKKLNGTYESKINRSLMDVLMLSFERFDIETLESHKEKIKDRFEELQLNEERKEGDKYSFVESITEGTSDKKKVIFRLNKWYNELESIING